MLREFQEHATAVILDFDANYRENPSRYLDSKTWQQQLIELMNSVDKSYHESQAEIDEAKRRAKSSSKDAVDRDSYLFYPHDGREHILRQLLRASGVLCQGPSLPMCRLMAGHSSNDSAQGRLLRQSPLRIALKLFNSMATVLTTQLISNKDLGEQVGTLKVQEFNVMLQMQRRRQAATVLIDVLSFLSQFMDKRLQKMGVTARVLELVLPNLLQLFMMLDDAQEDRAYLESEAVQSEVQQVPLSGFEALAKLRELPKRPDLRHQIVSFLTVTHPEFPKRMKHIQDKGRLLILAEVRS
jgi:hypothetical protein